MRRSLYMLCVLAIVATDATKAADWQPDAGHTQIKLWPSTVPDAKPMPGPETVKVGEHAVAVTNISVPTMTVYPPAGKNSGAAVVVFPGGGFQILAMDLEGTEVCDWLTQRGVTCVLLKYRVPSEPYQWQCNCRPHNLMLSLQALDDAQRALRLVRHNASEWHIDPHKIGVLGFSAGGYLVAEASTNYGRHLYKSVDDADSESSRPDFALAIYPGHLATESHTLNPNVPVTKDTPPTFILQAEDDDVDGVKQALVYYAALQKAGVPTEMHLFAHGGHAFGLRRTSQPITHWTDLADTWLRSIGMIDAP